MKHFATFEIFGKLVQRDDLQPTQNNGQQFQSINFLIEKTSAAQNGQQYVQYIPLYATSFIAQSVANIPLGTELFVKGSVRGQQAKTGSRFSSLTVTEVARIQPKPQGYSGQQQPQQFQNSEFAGDNGDIPSS